MKQMLHPYHHRQQNRFCALRSMIPACACQQNRIVGKMVAYHQKPVLQNRSHICYRNIHKWAYCYLLNANQIWASDVVLVSLGQNNYVSLDSPGGKVLYGVLVVPFISTMRLRFSLYKHLSNILLE